MFVKKNVNAYLGFLSLGRNFGLLISLQHPLAEKKTTTTKNHFRLFAISNDNVKILSEKVSNRN